MKKSKYIISLGLLLGLTGCFDLNQEPEGVISSSNPFTSVGEMSSYLDQFYESGVRVQSFGAGGDGSIAGYDTYSDNMASSSVRTVLTGERSKSGAGKLTTYNYIRNVNFFLTNLDNCAQKGTAAYNQCVGEGYYFRAWYYFQLLKSYGGVTWLDRPLDPDTTQMRIPRDSRTSLTDHILADLDLAISNLKEVSNCASMRVHRDVARTLKSEVALYEGTWEKYHKAQNDPFFEAGITDQKINEYFTIAAAAAKAVMDRGVWKIYTGAGTDDSYRSMFQTTDLSGNPEVLWFKKYDGDEVGNNVNRYLNEGGGSIGISASLVDDYLTIDGRPFTGEEKLEAKKVYGNELLPTVRDPRLAQTVATPGQMLRPDRAPFSYPPLKGTSAYNVNITGYSMLKHVQVDYTGNLDAEFKGATPAIQFRYADVLLNYAEALAELDGVSNASAIIEAVRPLRQRVGMPDMDFDREYNTDTDYPFHNLDKYIQAVRRERRVEQACEGRRLDDIFRWAAADVLIVGKWHLGALFTGSDLATAPESLQLKYDQPEDNNIFLTGKPGDTYRYIIPNNPAGYPDGWQFKLNRDYLNPIQDRMLVRSGWQQNPGW